MKKIAVVYWSGGGNTEAMAKAAVDGANKAGGEATLFRMDAFSAQDLKDYRARMRADRALRNSCTGRFLRDTMRISLIVQSLPDRTVLLKLPQLGQ